MKTLKELVENNYQEQLSKPIDKNEIKYRVQQSGLSNGKPWARLIAYIDSRVVIERLNNIFGVFGWEDSYKDLKESIECTLTIKCLDDKGDTVSISKRDVGNKSNIESEKGGYSDALKRAAVKLGIGLDLYSLGTTYATFVDKGTKGAMSAKIENKWYYWVVNDNKSSQNQSQGGSSTKTNTNTSSKPDLASEGQKKALFAVMGKEEYTKHKEFIEEKMTKAQASKKIEELNKLKEELLAHREEEDSNEYPDEMAYNGHM